MSIVVEMGGDVEARRWARVLGGDQEAWNELVEQYDRLVWHVIHGFRLQPDDAADVHQHAWLRLAEHLDTIRDPSRVGSWLATTARRECLRLASARPVVEAGVDVADLAVDDSPDEFLLADERAVAVRRAFASLPVEHQQLLRLLVAEPAFTYEEISVILDIPVGSIGPTRTRCLQRMARHPGVMSLKDMS